MDAGVGADSPLAPALLPTKMNAAMQSFQHIHENRPYTVSVRLCPDGYVSGYTRAAVAHAFAGIVNYRDILGDVQNADALYDIITEIRDESMAVTARPWASWQELSASRLDEMATFFFSDLQKKQNESQSFETTTRMKEMTDLICATMTISRMRTRAEAKG
jgi:hypothetical protein